MWNYKLNSWRAQPSQWKKGFRYSGAAKSGRFFYSLNMIFWLKLSKQSKGHEIKSWILDVHSLFCWYFAFEMKLLLVKSAKAGPEPQFMMESCNSACLHCDLSCSPAVLIWFYQSAVGGNSTYYIAMISSACPLPTLPCLSTHLCVVGGWPKVEESDEGHH